ncbi:MAG: serine/threonine-protein phosphatase [Planctomycetes bacterium]|nr:serine/threonine-protein phosphatase [Planctomycetota bacterium]
MPRPRTDVIARDQAAPEREPVVDQAQVERWLEHEQCFQVTTVDGLNWIDPFTATLVEAPFGYREVAAVHLATTRPWRAHKRTLPILVLLNMRWMHHLRAHLDTERRYKVFTDKGWLNPYTGDWDPAVGLDGGRLSLATAQAIAQALVRTLGFMAPPLLPQNEIDRIASDAQRGKQAPPPATATDLLIPSQAAPAVTSTLHRVKPVVTTETQRKPVTEVEPPSHEMVRARSVMDKLLRPPPTMPGFDIAIEFHPAESIGGDFYDFIALPQGGWFFVLGDVSGHGSGAALVATSALKTLRYIVPTGIDLRTTMARLNDDIRPDMPSGFFISAFAAIIDPGMRTMTCVCAGHHPAVVASLRRPATLQKVGLPGPALGLIGGSALANGLRETRFAFEPGDVFLQFTDGMFEVNNAQGIEFGNLRTLGSCVANLEYPCAQMARRMVLEIKKFAGGPLPDDATVVAMAVGDPGG